MDHVCLDKSHVTGSQSYGERGESSLFWAQTGLCVRAWHLVLPAYRHNNTSKNIYRQPQLLHWARLICSPRCEYVVHLSSNNCTEVPIVQLTSCPIVPTYGLPQQPSYQSLMAVKIQCVNLLGARELCHHTPTADPLWFPWKGGEEGWIFPLVVLLLFKSIQPHCKVDLLIRQWGASLIERKTDQWKMSMKIR